MCSEMYTIHSMFRWVSTAVINVLTLHWIVLVLLQLQVDRFAILLSHKINKFGYCQSSGDLRLCVHGSYRCLNNFVCQHIVSSRCL